MTDLSERVQKLEDRFAINDLIVRYFLAADGDDLAGVGNSFTEDASFSSSGQLGGRGREGIVEFIRTARTHMGLTIHTPHYAHTVFSATDRASGIVGAHLELVLAGVSMCGAVRYVDEYVREKDAWRIQSRDMRTIYMASWLEVGSALRSDKPVRWPGAEPAESDFPRRG